MRYGFEIASVSGGLAMIALANLIVIDILPFAVPIFNMMRSALPQIMENAGKNAVVLGESVDGLVIPAALQNDVGK